MQDTYRKSVESYRNYLMVCIGLHKLSTFYELAKADLRTTELLRIQIGFTTFSHVGGMEQWQQELALLIVL